MMAKRKSTQTAQRMVPTTGLEPIPKVRTAGMVATPDPPEQPANLSHLVRIVFKRMGDPNAKAAEVKRLAIEWYPQWKKQIEAAKFWSSYVTQNRDKAAEELGVNRVVLTGGGGSQSSGTLSFKDYESAGAFVETFCDGDVEKAQKLVDFLYGKNITRIRTGLKAWCDLVQSVGSPEAALKALEAMKSVGGVIDR